MVPPAVLHRRLRHLPRLLCHYDGLSRKFEPQPDPAMLGLRWCGGAASARAGSGLPPQCGGRLWLAWPLLPRPRLQARLRLHATRVIFYPTLFSVTMMVYVLDSVGWVCWWLIMALGLWW
jgi:hypothetical protein